MVSSAPTRSVASSDGLLQVGGRITEVEETRPPEIDEEGGYLAREPEGPPGMFITNWRELAIDPVFRPEMPIPKEVDFRGQKIAPTAYHFGRNEAQFNEWTPA